MATLKGNREPRIWTRPLRTLTRRTSLGFEAIEFIEGVLGWKLHPWQKWWYIHALELQPGRGQRFRFRTVLTLVGRQNGKTKVMAGLVLWFLHMHDQKNAILLSTDLAKAEETWDELAEELIEIGFITREKNLDLKNGARALKLDNGSVLRPKAKNDSTRGKTADIVIFDELGTQKSWDAWSGGSKTRNARPNSLVIAFSNAGDQKSIVLNSYQDKARQGLDPLTALFEWSAEDGCDVSDPAAWAAANPSMGYMIEAEALRSDSIMDPPDVFRREVLCQRADELSDMAVSRRAWLDCVDESLDQERWLDRTTALCVDISPDLQHATLVAAYVENEKVHLAVVKAWEGKTATEDLRTDLPGIKKKFRRAKLGWFPSGPVAALRIDMNRLRAHGLDSSTTLSACQGLAEQVAAHRVIHLNDPLLNEHVLTAKRYQRGDGWRFIRQGVGNVDAAYAAAGAVHLARTANPPPTVRVINR